MAAMCNDKFKYNIECLKLASILWNVAFVEWQNGEDKEM